jgi:hypothetical protein
VAVVDVGAPGFGLDDVVELVAGLLAVQQVLGGLLVGQFRDLPAGEVGVDLLLVPDAGACARLIAAGSCSASACAEAAGRCRVWRT